MATEFLDSDGLTYAFSKVKTQISTELANQGITTAGTGAAYTATVDGITALTAGATFVMLPHETSTSKTATLNVNGLGAKMIRRRVSNSTVTTVAASADNWLYANKPIRVTFDGTYWVADMDRPNAADIYGTVAIENGGTGATTAEAALTALGAEPAGTAASKVSTHNSDTAAHADIREDVEKILSMTEDKEVRVPTANLCDGVFEYGSFNESTGAEHDSYTPITISFRSANYLPVQGGKSVVLYYDKAAWNNNNQGKNFRIVQYDADKNLVLASAPLFYPYAQTARPSFALEANTAYIRVSFDLWSEIPTPLDEILVGIYYLEDATLSFIPYTLVEQIPMVMRTRVIGAEPLIGKKIVYDGDSICESRMSGTAANGGGYAKLIADYTGGVYTNIAVGGARLTTYSGGHSVVDNLQNLPTDGDLYCFQGGINDFWSNISVGECSLTDYTGTVDAATICGAMETIFRYCLDNLVGKPVCFVITHKIKNTPYTANSTGKTFKDYRDAMVKVCEKYSIPYYDAYSESGLNGWNTAQSNAYLTANSTGAGDGIHPNEEGYKRYYVPQLLTLFRSIMPV